MHTIIINKPVSEVADGLVLGNGDLSVSCYQKQGKLVFQFGKNDFWDNRLDFSRNPKPAHIQELRETLFRDVPCLCSYTVPDSGSPALQRPERMDYE